MSTGHDVVTGFVTNIGLLIGEQIELAGLHVPDKILVSHVLDRGGSTIKRCNQLRGFCDSFGATTSIFWAIGSGPSATV